MSKLPIRDSSIPYAASWPLPVSMAACSMSAEYAIRPRMGQPLRVIWVVTFVRSTFSS